VREREVQDEEADAWNHEEPLSELFGSEAGFKKNRRQIKLPL
jgi:hypothetical protein